jgi:hypothetical protein
MQQIRSVDPAPASYTKPTFLVDWMTTKYCNLNCAYCDDYSHDNHSPHPSFDDSVKTIDFIYEYVDLYMQYKRNWQKGLVLNVYGGESMIHPDIVNILKETRIRHAAYKDKWSLTVQVTTNAVVGINTLSRAMDYVDDWTVSFHSTSLPKQIEMSLKNLKFLHDSGKPVRCVIMMNPIKWEISMSAIDFCKQHGIRYTAKALDNKGAPWYYTEDQMQFIKNYWIENSVNEGKAVLENAVIVGEDNQAFKQGRACCGGRSLCINQDFKNRVSVVPLSNFTDWYCSVNWYFLHINQHTGEIYNNKDCRISLNNVVEPVGYLTDTASIIATHKHMLDTKTMPVIKCINTKCDCGTCAPKAIDLETFKTVMKSHWLEDRCQPNTYTHPTILTSQGT